MEREPLGLAGQLMNAESIIRSKRVLLSRSDVWDRLVGCFCCVKGVFGSQI